MPLPVRAVSQSGDNPLPEGRRSRQKQAGGPPPRSGKILSQERNFCLFDYGISMLYKNSHMHPRPPLLLTYSSSPTDSHTQEYT